MENSTGIHIYHLEDCYHCRNITKRTYRVVIYLSHIHKTVTIVLSIVSIRSGVL